MLSKKVKIKTIKSRRVNSAMSCESCKLHVIILLASIIILLPSIRSQDQTPHVCLQNGNYTSNSTYSSNLNNSLSSLSTNMENYGFNNASFGRNPDRVNAIALCRADTTLGECRTCVQNAAVALVQFCPYQRQAIIWSEYCMLRYSDEPIYGTQTNDPGLLLRNTGDITSPEQFRNDRARLLDDLRAQAANGSSEMKAGAGTRNTSDSNTLHGLLQCTPDLSAEECDNCLVRAGQSIRSCCDTSRGVRALLPSCNIRYELYPFYNETRLQEFRVVLPPAPSPPTPSASPLTPAASPPGSGDDNTTTIIIIVVVTVVVCLILAVCGVIFLRKRMKQRSRYETTETTDEISSVESLQYDFGKIRAATNDFADSNKLGEGGFGVVYKGKLLNGQEIAVKRLSKDSGQGNMEFKNEVLLLAKLQHRNLVRLLGFALEGTERLLIYEFVQNSSLDQFIFDPIKRSYLGWNSRYKVMGGIARGLLYLHEDSQLRIVHRDLKASNILLDKEMNPKIADFGMARLFEQDETQGNTSKVVGTYGYMSPEYAMHGQFSPKSDVFSFGVLVLEIVSGQKNSYTQNEENEDLLSFVWKNWSEGTAENVIDPVLRASTNSTRDMLRCIRMGLLCVQQNAIDRPTMASIVLMLNSDTVTLPVPNEPAFFAHTLYGPRISYGSKESNSSSAPKPKAAISEGSSLNSVSVTELYPR